MIVEWDPEKARLNDRKHGVSFADAVIVLEDDRALTERDLSTGVEERWVTMGLDALGRVLVVVYTWRGENLRLISARNATKREREKYEEPDEA
ncbi:MAG: BrnT family toxin [Acidobacteria bacterium]|nr:BrnT family toxin [Acidobacteriota bacterium]